MRDVHEQHELEALKSWWKSNGNAVIIGVSVALAGVIGWQSYQSYQQTNQEAASARYEALHNPAAQKDFAQVSSEAKQLLVDQPNSPYAVGAAFLLAKHAVEQADWEGAQTHLRWVLAHNQEPHWQALATIRLARVLVEAAQYDQAIVLLDQAQPKMTAAFQAMADYVRGMALMQQQHPEAAQKAFASAQQNPAAPSSIRSLSQLWVDDLGQATP